MQSLIEKVNQNYMKNKVTDVKSGDTVRVHQKITEGDKTRTQVFEGMVIGTRRKKSHTASITVRRIASGIGVEKTFMIHSPLIERIEVTKRSSVRRNRLNYMKQRSGKSARLVARDFDSEAVNAANEPDEVIDVDNHPAEQSAEDEGAPTETKDESVNDDITDKAEIKNEEKKEAPEAKDTEKDSKTEAELDKKTDEK